MPRTTSLISGFALAALLIALASHTARADEDVAKAAAEAQKQLPDIQKMLAGGTDNQKRLRIDKFEAGDQIVKVVGVYLDAPPAKADDPVPFDQVTDELFKSLRERLKEPNLKFDSKGIERLAQDKHPHVVLQVAANAAGASNPLADQVRLEGSRFNATGELVLTGTRGKDDAVGTWLTAAIPTALAKNKAVRMKDEKPLVIDEVKPVEWKLSAAGVQKALASSADVAVRRLRADRAMFSYEVAKSDDTVRVSGLRYVVSGIRLGEDKLDVIAVQDMCRALWPEALAGANQVPVTVDFGAGITEPTAKLQAAVAGHTALDGVRVDPGAEFGSTGELELVGIQPGLAPDGRKELAAVYQEVLNGLAARGDAAAERYKRLAAGPVSAQKMKVVATPKLLTELRDWTAGTMDDARLARLYFAADSGLRIQVRTVTKDDGDKIAAQFRAAVTAYLPVTAGEPSKYPDPATEPSLFQASLTAQLRKDMAADQKKWNGVLIERGYFDALGRYTIRGVVDAAEQNDGLAALLDKIRADSTPQYSDFFTPAPTKPALDVIPMNELLDRVKRATPAYPAFDGVRVESARYDANVNLIFDAHIVGQPDREAAPLLGRLIRDDPKYRRRAPADKQALLVRTAGPGYADDQVAEFSLAYGAKLMAKADASREDRAKAREWLDVATLHYPNEAAVWFLDAYYNLAIVKDEVLARRDLFRVIDIEGVIAFNGPAQRKRRYEAARDLQGPIRNDLEALWLECFREVRDGAKPLTLAQAGKK
jgi:hypothetical protein